MTVIELLALLKEKDVQLSIKGDQLVVEGRKQSLRQPEVLARLRENKAALIELIRSGQYSAGPERVPANVIEAGCNHITPQMLPLVNLSQAAIDLIVATVPGGTPNVQDIYPLAPLQAGILYHHLSAEHGDPYLLQALYGFDSLGRFDDFSRALKYLIGRHDILRTAMVWEQLDEPVQVVLRQARLICEEVVLDPANGDIAEQLSSRFDARHYRLDLRQAPMLRLAFAHDSANRRWLAVLLFHHLALDHIAMDVVRHEMQAYLLGRTAELDTAVPYRNYVVQARLGVTEEQHERFFREMLGDIDEPTLPFGLRNVQGDGCGIEEASMPVDLDVNRRLRHLARQLGVSAASLMHLAWALVLGKVSGKQDVVFGSVLMGRMQGGEGAYRALGIFINTLPLRVNVGGQNVRAGVRETHARLTVLLGHEHASLALAQRCSGIASPAPLFSALLNYRHSAGALTAEAVSAWQGIQPLGAEERSNYPLNLNVDDLGNGFTLTALTASPVSAQRVCAYMHTALEQLVDALEHTPQASLAQVSILPAAERQQILVDFNATDTQYPMEQTVHALFEARVQDRPDAPAAVHDDQQLSYHELNTRANRLAHHLIGLGVQPGEPVGILLERSFDLLISQLAIAKAAAVYVPLDINAPLERQAFMVQDSGSRWLLSLSSRKVPEGTQRLDLDRLNLSAEPPHNPALPQSSQSAGYIMYTSGSTGTPKGVLVPHRAISRLVVNNGYAELNEHDRVSFISNPSFDASTFDVWSALLNGGCVVVVAQDVLLSPNEFATLLQAQSVSVLCMTTGLFHQYAEALLPVFGQLRYVIVGGDVLDLAVIARVLKDGAPAHLLNAYGPTEAATISTVHEVTCADSGSIPIGRPIGNSRVYILDAEQQPVPIGVTGELYIGGVGVALGYLNRPELTAEKFLLDPFTPRPGARMYRSGDLGCWLPDGSVQYQGRRDDQVKIRGFRIELGEIEARLSHCVGVKENVVLAREDQPGLKRLVAYVVAEEGVELSVAQLRDELSAALADYMVPSAFVVLASFSLTANGKLDRRALPAPDDQAYASSAYEAPQGLVETSLAQIWSDVLKIERVGRHDHFFELGGHSLLAMTLIERMRQVGLSADVRVLFSQPTLAALAAAIGGGREVVVPANGISVDSRRITPGMLPLASLDQSDIDRIVANVPGGVANVQDIYPLAPLQAGILYHHLSAEQGDPYLFQALYSFDSRERLNDFSQALQYVIDRHDILRTAMVWEQLDEPVQVVLRQARLNSEEVLLDPANGDIAEQLTAHFDARYYRLDLRQAPVLHLAFTHDRSHQRWVASLLWHHIAMDHTALEVVRHEMQAYLLGRTGELGAAAPYRNYVAQARLGVTEEEHEKFFREMLGDIDEPTLPFGLQDVQGDGRGIEEASVPVDLDVSRRLRHLARHLGVSAASLVHLAWAQVLGKVSGKQDVVFGTVLLGRMQAGEGADRALGMFINTLPLRVDVGEQGVCAGVKAVHARFIALLGHEHASLALAQRCSGVALPAPLFSALLNYRHSVADITAETTAAWQGMQSLSGKDRTNYPLTLSVDDLGEGFQLTAQVATRIGARRICDYMNATLHNLVAALGATPMAPLQSLSILPADERQHLLQTWNASETLYANTALIHSLVEAQADTRPDATAVIHEDKRLSYGELNARANQVAHGLLALGIRPDDRVAICVERGLEMIVGLLGILKAGAGYVPIDPTSPQARIRYMLLDSAPVAMLSQSSTEHLLTGLSVPKINLNHRDLQGRSVRNPQVPGLTSSHLAYVIYTSGSTGLPKGVMIEHRNVARLFSATQGWFNFNDQDVWALFHSFAFDFSVWEIWGALTHGGQLLVVPQLISRSPDDCYSLLCAAGVTILNQTPSAFRSLIAAQGQSTQDHSLRKVIFGGEALETGILKPWYARVANAGTQLVNMYGITETTVHVTYRALKAADAQRVGVSPIGGRIPDLQLYVLDAQREPVPVGVVGELYVGGAGVARGYLNRKELTTERFIPDPFSGRNNARLYKTGDLGRWLEDGSLEYLGRNDEQVKIRGFRIEPGEIESRLAACEGVREAVVIARTSEEGDKRLVAYVIAQENTELLVADLRSQLLLTLADYMVPSAFVILDALPLTTNGKLDRKRLPLPGQSAVVMRDYVAPQTEAEQAIAAIWQDVLSLPQVGLHDDFFELGGDSIRAINLISRMQKVFPASRVSIMSFYQAPTVHGLVALLKAPVDQAHEWLPELTRSTRDNALTLVCVPYAGASAMVYQPLADQLRQRLPSARVYAVALPGNQMETRFDENLSLMDMARACVERIRQRIPGRVNIYGHCAGCMLALEITCQLERQGHEVGYVMLGGTFAPSAWSKFIPWSNPWRWHSDASLHRLIKSWGGASALSETALTGLLQGFRRDSGLAMQHAKRHGRMEVRAPIINVLSQDDPLTRGKEARYRFWGRFTRVVHGVLLADGGHYFVATRAAEVAEVILQTHQHRDTLIATPTTLRLWSPIDRSPQAKHGSAVKGERVVEGSPQ